MNLAERTIAVEMARPMPPRMCVRGCGMAAHHGGCKGQARFAGEPGAIRTCGRAGCGRKLSISNPGPLCRPCQDRVLREGIATRERDAQGAELLEVDRARKAKPVPGARPAQAVFPEAAAAAAVCAPGGVCTVRIDAIPESAENRLESEIGELYQRMMALGPGEALRIPRKDAAQIRNTVERLRTRLKRGNAGRLKWKRDGLTMYVWALRD